MRLVVQRVANAAVSVAGETRGAIARGLLVLVGFAEGDDARQLPWAAEKIVNLRIFEDAQGKMNLSVLDLLASGDEGVEAGVLLVPNFTLAGDASKGRRPSFDRALRPEHAEPMFDALVREVKSRATTNQKSLTVATGVFRAEMKVALVNDGPITLVIDVPT